MRSAFVAAALVASALAVPFNKHEEKRALVTTTDIDIITVTDYVTVTLPEGSAPTGGNQKFGFGDHRHHRHHHHGEEPPQTTPSTTSNIFPSTKPSTQQPSTNTNSAPHFSPTQSAPTSAPSSPSNGGGSTPTQNPGATPTDYQEIAVYHHNIHRANHSASDVTWDDNLASIAAQIASSCVYAHNT